MGSVTVAVTHMDKGWRGTFHGERMASCDNANESERLSGESFFM